MALTTAQQVRLRIQDAPKVFDTTLFGNGTAVSYPIAYSVVTSATAFVPRGATAWSATGATIESGYVTFSDNIAANSAFRVRGVYSVFSDDEIGQFTAAGGNVNGAALEAVQTLMFDSLKRASWSAPDGSRYDDTAAMKLLTDMYDRLKVEQEESAAEGGVISSWALNQENY